MAAERCSECQAEGLACPASAMVVITETDEAGNVTRTALCKWCADDWRDGLEFPAHGQSVKIEPAGAASEDDGGADGNDG